MILSQQPCMPMVRHENKKNTNTTAILVIIDARYHDFNGFPVVNWY